MKLGNMRLQILKFNFSIKDSPKCIKKLKRKIAYIYNIKNV